MILMLTYIFTSVFNLSYLFLKGTNEDVTLTKFSGSEFHVFITVYESVHVAIVFCCNSVYLLRLDILYCVCCFEK